MTIAALFHVTLIGAARDREPLLAELQQAGLLHPVALVRPPDSEVANLDADVASALRYLETSPLQRRPARHSQRAPIDIQRRALELKAREADLRDERDHLAAKAAALEPWGDFDYPPLGALGHGPIGPLRLWFYRVPTYQLSQLEGRDFAWEVVARTPGVAYVVVISDEEPADMPVPRTRTGSRSKSAVEARMHEIDEALEDIAFQRAELTKYRAQLESHVDDILDAFARRDVAWGTWADDDLFAMAGWVPKDRWTELEAIASARNLALLHRSPTPDDQPPTLLHNEGLSRAGQSLVTFYTTPSYFEWDPSRVVFASFAVFFAMILSDAGYAVLLGALLALFWRSAGRTLGAPLRGGFAVMLGLGVVWGVMIGSYFGVSPLPTTTLGSLRVVRIDDYDTMMQISVTVGALHVVLANLIRAFRIPSAGALGAAGWCLAVLTGLAWWLAQGDPRWAEPIERGMPFALGLSGFLILFFTRAGGSVGARLFDGARALTNVTSAFGDVLSYLRLFALGLASSSLGLAFNDLAGQAAQTEGIGLVLAGLVLLVGHGINLGLAIMSGFVHGLRLNFIEFFRWGTAEEGRPFRPFALRRRARAG